MKVAIVPYNSKLVKPGLVIDDKILQLYTVVLSREIENLRHVM